MKFSIKEIRSQIDRCQSAETGLLNLRRQLDQSRAELVRAETEATAHAADSKSFDKVIDKLDAKRREIVDIEYRVALHDRNVQLLRASLQQTMIGLVADARERAADLRTRTMGELQRRVSPFVAQKAAKYVVPVSRVLPLMKPMKLCASIAGHVPELRSACTAASVSILRKYEDFTAAIVAVEALVGIAATR